MYSTLFHIPSRLGSEPGIPLFGFGLLLVLWAMAAVGSSLWVAFRSGWRDAVRGLLLPLVITGAMIVWVLPALDDGRGIPIRGYGVMLLAAVAAGTWLSIVRGRRMGFDADTLLALGTQIFLWGIVGARLFYVIEYHEQFFSAERSLAATVADVVNVAAGGLVVFGSLPTAAAAAWWFAYRRKLNLLVLADCIAPGLLVGLALGRVGCFLNGCCYGGECELPWAVTFPPESPPWFDQVQRGLLPNLSPQQVGRSLPIHPAQLYAAIDAGILAWLAICFTPLARRDGQVFALVLSIHPVSRILLEMIRVDEPPALGTPFSISQLISLVLLGTAGILWVVTFRRPPRLSFDSQSPTD
jgi:phosphatidylglycerol:prolipoprotein diacylglycerol transferase